MNTLGYQAIKPVDTIKIAINVSTRIHRHTYKYLCIHTHTKSYTNETTPHTYVQTIYEFLLADMSPFLLLALWALVQPINAYSTTQIFRQRHDSNYTFMRTRAISGLMRRFKSRQVAEKLHSNMHAEPLRRAQNLVDVVENLIEGG
jgi:hypothetical protein